MITYTCKYSPIEIFRGFACEAKLLNEECDNFDFSQNLTHMNMCSHCKSLLETIYSEGIRELVLINCCDSMRRIFDIIKDELDFAFLMDLPHSGSDCSVERLKSELLRFIKEYSDYSGKDFNLGDCIKAFEEAEDFEQEDFIALMGARVGSGLLSKIQSMVPIKVRSFCCNDNRRLQAAPDEFTSVNDFCEWYARELLSQPACMRMSDISSRKALANVPGLRGIIYHTVKFCDYYGFEYMALSKEVKLPVTKIESDFTTQSFGQLSTRIGGFVESLGLKEVSLMPGKGKYYLGIDSGSTTTNMALIDDELNLIKHVTVRTGAKAQKGAEKAFEKLGVSMDDIKLVFATGYGRDNIDFADHSITEISCHAKGAHFLRPSARTIIDIGGQDSKAILMDEEGKVHNFAMNDKCAAGTGRFLENMTRVLEIELDEIGKIGLDWKEDLNISSMCTVFAESEVVSLIADNKQIPDIVHGLNKSVAAKTLALVNRIHGKSEYIMTGGGARNKGVVQCIEEILGEKVFVPEFPDMCGAIGAALYAKESADN